MGKITEKVNGRVLTMEILRGALGHYEDQREGKPTLYFFNYPFH
jgi:hypothetical protein